MDRRRSRPADRVRAGHLLMTGEYTCFGNGGPTWVNKYSGDIHAPVHQIFADVFSHGVFATHRNQGGFGAQYSEIIDDITGSAGSKGIFLDMNHGDGRFGRNAVGGTTARTIHHEVAHNEERNRLESIDPVQKAFLQNFRYFRFQCDLGEAG
jgi:hypothetical protein